MAEDSPKRLRDDIFDLVRLVDYQVIVEGEEFEFREEVIDKKMVVDYQDIFFVDVSIVSIVETTAVKGALHGIAVIRFTAYLRPEIGKGSEFVLIPCLRGCDPFTELFMGFSLFYKLSLSLQAEIVVFPFEQRIRKFLRQDFLEEDQIFVYELILQSYRSS